MKLEALLVSVLLHRRIERDTGWPTHSLQYQSRQNSIQVPACWTSRNAVRRMKLWSEARAAGALSIDICHCLTPIFLLLGAQDLAASVADEIRTVAGKDAEVWAVTHSLGGIVLRHVMGLTGCGEPTDTVCQVFSVDELSFPWCWAIIHQHQLVV